MKKQMFGALAAGCLLASMIALPARAQEPGTSMRVTIPFDFIVRGRTLPAGNYEVRRVGDSPEILEIRNVNHKRDEMVFDTETTQANKPPRHSELIFNRYGDSSFLSEIVVGGEEMGREVAATRAERQLRREMASNNRQPETVALVAN